MVRAPIKLALLSSALVNAVLACAGCRPGGAPGDTGVVLHPPPSWRPVAPATWMVPGTPLRAWTGPEGSSLVVYRTLPVPGSNAAMLAEALGNRLLSLPETRLLVKETAAMSGTTAARVEAVAPGTGDALAPSGLGTPVAPDGKALVPTRQVTLVFGRPGETVCVCWHMPEKAHDQIAAQIDEALETLRFTAGGKSQAQGY